MCASSHHAKLAPGHRPRPRACGRRSAQFVARLRQLPLVRARPPSSPEDTARPRELHALTEQRRRRSGSTPSPRFGGTGVTSIYVVYSFFRSTRSTSIFIQTQVNPSPTQPNLLQPPIQTHGKRGQAQPSMSFRTSLAGQNRQIRR